MYLQTKTGYLLSKRKNIPALTAHGCAWKEIFNTETKTDLATSPHRKKDSTQEEAALINQQYKHMVCFARLPYGKHFYAEPPGTGNHFFNNCFVLKSNTAYR